MLQRDHRNQTLSTTQTLQYMPPAANYQCKHPRESLPIFPSAGKGSQRMGIDSLDPRTVFGFKIQLDLFQFGWQTLAKN